MVCIVRVQLSYFFSRDNRTDNGENTYIVFGHSNLEVKKPKIQVFENEIKITYLYQSTRCVHVLKWCDDVNRALPPPTYIVVGT